MNSHRLELDWHCTENAVVSAIEKELAELAAREEQGQSPRPRTVTYRAGAGNFAVLLAGRRARTRPGRLVVGMSEHGRWRFGVAPTGELPGRYVDRQRPQLDALIVPMAGVALEGCLGYLVRVADSTRLTIARAATFGIDARGDVTALNNIASITPDHLAIMPKIREAKMVNRPAVS